MCDRRYRRCVRGGEDRYVCVRGGQVCMCEGR